MVHPTNPIHVVHIASGDLWAGAEVQLFTLCKTLNNMPNIRISVILLNHGILKEKLRKQNIYVEVLDETNLNSVRIFAYLIRLLRQLKPNIVHTHRIKENILGSFAAKTAGNIPSLRTAHGAPEHRPSLKRPHKYLFYLLDWLTARLIQKKIIAVSEDLKTILAKKYPSKKLVVIENGVDIEALAPYKKPNLPKEDNKLNSFKVGLVGRLVPVKRVDLFIETAKYMRDRHPELSIHFHIYGDGPLHDELKQLACSLNVNDIVKFEGHCDDIHRQIASLDALLITSDHEGLPMTLLEAMALGTPVLAHSVGGITKVCQNGKCCWLIDQNSLELLSQEVETCLNNPELSQTFTNIALQQIHKKYSAYTNAKSYEIIYNGICSGQ